MIERIMYIIQKDGGQSTKQTMKWKNVEFRNVHVSDLTNDDFADGWITDKEILDFYDLVNRQWNKAM
jgi:hypothetical protein